MDRAEGTNGGGLYRLRRSDPTLAPPASVPGSRVSKRVVATADASHGPGPTPTISLLGSKRRRQKTPVAGHGIGCAIHRIELQPESRRVSGPRESETSHLIHMK